MEQRKRGQAGQCTTDDGKQNDSLEKIASSMLHKGSTGHGWYEALKTGLWTSTR